jgi:hypothetical protein
VLAWLGVGDAVASRAPRAGTAAPRHAPHAVGWLFSGQRRCLPSDARLPPRAPGHHRRHSRLLHRLPSVNAYGAAASCNPDALDLLPCYFVGVLVAV